jgi:hypothetical protein
LGWEEERGNGKELARRKMCCLTICEMLRIGLCRGWEEDEINNWILGSIWSWNWEREGLMDLGGKTSSRTTQWSVEWELRESTAGKDALCEILGFRMISYAKDPDRRSSDSGSCLKD